MRTLKVTTWNVAHFGRVIGEGAKEAARLPAIVNEIRELAPDVLCLVECTPDLPALRRFCETELDGDYVVPVIEGTDAALASRPDDARAALAQLYRMRGNRLTGSQWIWFLVRTPIAGDAHLLPPAMFDTFAASQFTDADDRERQDGEWHVYNWGQTVRSRHGHYRHPQVLVLDVDGVRLEIIGVHMKSKLNTFMQRNDPFEDRAQGTFQRGFLDEALTDRIQLATEAAHVRNYIDARFAQDRDPAVMVVGDLNDGPGKELLERRFLFFDLISNIQGDVFFAQRFLNHALFDFPGELRWSLHLTGGDPVDPERDPDVLLDHILFTQRLVDKTQYPRVDSKAGLVEHAIHERINATLRAAQRTSDHRPVSVTLTLQPA